MKQDVPSAIDLRTMEDARKWAMEAERRPGRAEILDRIVEEAATLAPTKPRILELGSGPGFLAQRVFQRIPNADYAALDFSPAMHALARRRLERHVDQVTFLVRSFKSGDWPEGLAPFDLVLTNQAVHELRHKRYAVGLHRQVRGLLKPSGAYLMSDHFSDPGGLPNTELFMTMDEQSQSLRNAGFAEVERIAVEGSLALHRARAAEQ
ncbi:MAG: class I SAM-dependent methyltransferase [Pseudomonadota bacterium]